MISAPRRSTPALILTAAAAALMASGCASLQTETGRSLVPTRHQTRVGPYLVFTGDPLPDDASAVRQLKNLETELATNLGVRADPSAGPIEVYILDDRDDFEHFLTFYFPELPSRRAFFLAQGPRRVVYTYLGDRLEEDLRHEATHALLHASVADLPLWLDEGLAEYFEVPGGRGGVNAEHLGRMPSDLASGWKPDLARLESLHDVREMTPRDYREAWAWVHYMLDGTDADRRELLAYMADLRTNSDALALSRRLQEVSPSSPQRLLIAHLGRLRQGTLAAEASSTHRAQRPAGEIRGQSPSTEVIYVLEEAPRRRGLFGRLVDALRGR